MIEGHHAVGVRTVQVGELELERVAPSSPHALLVRVSAQVDDDLLIVPHLHHRRTVPNKVVVRVVRREDNAGARRVASGVGDPINKRGGKVGEVVPRSRYPWQRSQVQVDDSDQMALFAVGSRSIEVEHVHLTIGILGSACGRQAVPSEPETQTTTKPRYVGKRRRYRHTHMFSASSYEGMETASWFPRKSIHMPMPPSATGWYLWPANRTESR